MFHGDRGRMRPQNKPQKDDPGDSDIGSLSLPPSIPPSIPPSLPPSLPSSLPVLGVMFDIIQSNHVTE